MPTPFTFARLNALQAAVKHSHSMVQANVGQKLLKRHILRVFSGVRSYSGFKITNYYKRNSETTPPYVILITKPPPTNYILTLIKPFSFVWYVIPLLKTGALASTCDLFVQVDDEKTRKNRCFFVWLPTITCNTCLVASTSGFQRSPGPP